MYKGAGTPANVMSSSVSTTTVAAPRVVYTAPPLMRENLKSCLHKKIATSKLFVHNFL